MDWSALNSLWLYCRPGPNRTPKSWQVLVAWKCSKSRATSLLEAGVEELIRAWKAINNHNNDFSPLGPPTRPSWALSFRGLMMTSVFLSPHQPPSALWSNRPSGWQFANQQSQLWDHHRRTSVSASMSLLQHHYPSFLELSRQGWENMLNHFEVKCTPWRISHVPWNCYKSIENSTLGNISKKFD